MEQRPPKPMTPFDSLVTPPYLYTLKLLLPYIPSSMQFFLAVYIKFLELRNTMDYFKGFPSHPFSLGMLDELKPYMEPGEKEMMEQMEGMMNIMEMIQSMQAMSESASKNSEGFNPMDMMKNMLTPEQQSMFDMYSNMFDNNINPPEQGDMKGET